MKRLYLTDNQVELVIAALRFYSRDLQNKFDNSMMIKDDEAAENINDIMNRLDVVLDIMTED